MCLNNNIQKHVWFQEHQEIINLQKHFGNIILCITELGTKSPCIPPPPPPKFPEFVFFWH